MDAHGGRPPEQAQVESHAALLLRRLIEEAQRALDTDNPHERIRILSAFVQPYAAWALREAVLDMRDHRGMSWSHLSDFVGLAQGVVARQARGLGPMVTITPSYDTSGEPEGFTPLRLALRTLVERIGDMSWDEEPEDSPVLALLYDPVMAMNSAASFGAAAPPPRTVEKVLQAADELDRALAASGQSTLSGQERAVLEAVAELRTVYGREQGAIRRDHGRRYLPMRAVTAQSSDGENGVAR